MTREEWREVLEHRARPAMLATVRPDGRSHLAPVPVRVAPPRVVSRKNVSD